MSLGGSSLAAASATLPKVVLRPDAACVMMLFEALHSEAGTFHSLAAAWISIRRAAAPPWRTYSFDWRMPWLPVEGMAPQTRVRAGCCPGLGDSVSTFAQSPS